MERVYAIGDNPASDIAGANAAGAHWTSVLVRTGMFTGAGNDAVHPARIVADDIGGAVDAILAREHEIAAGRGR